MNLKNDTGVSPFLIGGIVISCAAPAAALNIWPRIEQMISEGLSGHQLGIVLLVTMSVLGMAAVPFAMQKAENSGFWLVCATVGSFLALLNYALAVGAIGKGRDSETNSAASLLAQSQRIEKQIKELKVARSEAPNFKYTSEEMLATAREAVELAKQARDQECGKVGDNCRARVAQLSARMAELGDLSTHRAATAKDDDRSSALRKLEVDLHKLGTIPERIDPQAERLRGLLAIFGATFATQQVADGLISVLAITAEVFALVMPRILVTALGPGTVLVAIGGNSGGTAGPPLLPSPKATSKTPLPFGPVDTWLKAGRPPKGQKLECWAAYQTYKKSCNGAYTPVSYTQFQFELTKKAKKSEEAGKLYFTF